MLFVTILFGNQVFSSTFPVQSDSIVHYSSIGRYDLARNYLLSFQNKIKQLSDSEKVEYYIMIGNISPIAKKNVEGFEHIENAISLAQKIGSEYLIKKANIQLLEFYRKTGDYKSIPALVKKLRKAPPTDEIILCRLYHRLAAYYNELNAVKGGSNIKYLDTAIYYSNQSLALSKKNNLLDYQYTSYFELAHIYKLNSKLKSDIKSNNYIDSAIMTLNGKKELKYYNLLKLKSLLLLANKNYDSSIYYANLALGYGEKIDYYLLKNVAHSILTRAYFRSNDSLNGYKYRAKMLHERLRRVKSLHKEELDKVTLAYKVKEKDKLIAENKASLYKVEKEKSLYIFIGISLLIISIFIALYMFSVKRKNKQLHKLVKENEFLLGESNHRIKNNLQLIISLIDRELHKSDHAKQELSQISDQINAIATLHQQLYLSENKENVSFKKYLGSIEENFKSGLSQNSVDFSEESEDFEVPIDKAIYIGLLITELIINSLKHAFKEIDSKTIKISAVKMNNNTVNLKYVDNGKGLANEESPILVNLILKQLKASIIPTSGIGYILNIKFQI